MAWRVRFPVDEPVEVVTTHVDRETGNFFVQLNNSDSSKLDELMEEIISFVSRNNGDSKAKALKVGDACLAQYVDEVWYRGQVLSVDKNGFKVYFVDYGNSDFVEIKNVVAAPDRFLSLPPQAFECELANVRPVGGHWSTELLVQLEELILEQTFVAQAVSLKTNNVIVLSLFQNTDMTSLAVQPLITAGYLECTDDAFASVQSTPVGKYKFLELDNLSFEDVYLSYTENPNEFYCILLKNSTVLQKLMDELEMTYREATEDDYPLTSCCQDNPCCAKYSEDDMWYRAIITSESPSPSGEINVKFVDYGNSENVHISNLMELEERFLELPMQALECALYGIKPQNSKDSWPQDAIEVFEELTSGKHLVSFLNKVSNNTAEVFLFDTSEETKDINFAQVLVDNGKAIAVKPLNDYKKADNSQHRKSSFGIINLIPTSSEVVLVTNAESPSDFYCQLLKNSQDLDKLMSDLGQYYDSLGGLDDTITLPEAGMLCCGKYTEDNGWYRALVLTSDIANREVEVLYVDYGNIEVLPVTRIKELKPQFTSLPQQAIPCCLYGVSSSAPSWTDKAIQEFCNAVVDKKLMITVVSQSESQRCSVSLVETVGEEEYSINQQLVQRGFAISDGEHPGVSVETELMNYQPPPVVVGNYIDIEITHVDNMDQFWCHLTSSSDEMERLMSNLQDYYEENPPKGTDLNLFGIGSPCCVRFSEDKMWYRGKILEKKTNNRFKVRFVDYGNCEVSTSKSIAVLNPEFMQLPVQSIQCSLINLSSLDKKKSKFIHKFLEMVNGKELVCRMDERSKEGKYLVLIIDTNEGDGININEEMAAFIASAGKQASAKEPADTPKVTEPNVMIGDEVPVYITSISSPENFYCQLAASATELDNLMNNMETFYRPLRADEEAYTNPRVGDACCAMFTEDDGFYRATVAKVTSTGIEVRYLDYGNSEHLPLSRVKNLNSSFAKLPAQSFNAKSFSSSFDTPTQFEESVIDKELKAVIVRKDENGVYIVRLSDLNGTPLFSAGERSQIQLQGTSKRMLCKVKETKITVGKKVPVFITSVTNRDDFFCQLTETSAQLDDLMNEMEEYYRPLSEQEQSYCNPQIGEACCAMFTEDDGWYRAMVNKHSSTSLDVYYMDYGNSETIPLSRIKTLNQKFTTLPPQGFHACVKIPTGVDISTFKDTVLEKEFTAKIVTESSNKLYEVELFKADGSKLFEAEICYQVKEVQLTKGSKEHVYVTFFSTAENFFCQLAESSTQLDQLMDRLEEFYRPLGEKDECLTNPRVGDTCCAMFTEDDGWYRAVITKVISNTVEVNYLDYGNSEELPVSRIRRLLPCFAETNAQGFQASLVGDIPNKSEEIRAAIDGQELVVTVTDRKGNGSYGVVVYEMNGNELFGSQQDAAKPQVNRAIQDFLSAYNITPGNKLDVCGSHCESPSMFYLQLVKNRDVLQKIMTELSEVYCDLKPRDQAITNPVVGMFCAAKFRVDDEWYRAQILSIPSTNEVDVCYIDFGNSERIGSHDIKILAPAFHHTPVQAVKCRLQGAKEKWNAFECETFEILIVEQHLIAEVKAHDSAMKTLTVELHDTRGSNDLNILDVLRNKTGGSGKSLSQEKLPKLTTLPKLQLKDVENVLVESAESLDNFVCQFSKFNHDLDTVADMLYKIYHEGTPPAIVTAPLQINDVIAALFTEDEAWYRASVSAVNADGSVEVTFIDYGNAETIPKADLCHRARYLSKDLLRYPPMRGVACTLSRVSIDGQRYSWTQRAHEAFVRHVVEKEFQARLSSDSEPYKTILEDKSGSIHSWLTREKLVTTRETEPEVVLEDFYQINVEDGSSCEVYVTSVVNPQEFYVQQAVNGEAIDKVMDDLHAICTDGSRRAIMSINAGTLCAAQYTVDDAWYRARVTQVVGPDSFDVQFVDYGNTEVLSKERIKDLDPSLLELPAQALCCCLELKQPMSWNTETIAQFERITADKCLKMTVLKVIDDKLLVTIKNEEGTSLNDSFEHKAHESADKSSKTVEICLLPFPITEKQTGEVYLSHLANPGEFYVQLSGAEEELERLAEQCAQTYDGPENENYKMSNAQQDMFCCARYSEDNAWYRAQILNIDSAKQTATVLFVDHGNTDVVNLSADVRQLSADLSTSPCQAVPCTLAHGTWSPEQCSSFEVAAMDKPLQATFNKLVNNMWMVTLKDGSILLNQSLASQGETPSVKKPCLSTGDEPSVYIVSVDSPANVILQLSKYVSALEQLMTDIANNPPQDTLPITAPESGVSCLACFTEDESWYRAKVLECNDDKIKVLYVDYGNEEWISGDRIAPITEQFSELPEVCIKCTLDLSTIRGTWGETSGEKLVEVYGENELRCQIVSKTDDYFAVKLFLGDEDVLTKVTMSDAAVLDATESVEIPTTSCYGIKQLNAGDKIDVTCSHIETPGKLWCQFLEDEETLDNLMNRLDEVYSVLAEEELLVKSYDVSTACCGQFLEDDGWYRAEILGMEDEGVKVRYIDYGNEEVLPTTRLRSLKPEFLTTPRQAVACTLGDIQASGDEWSQDAVTLVEEFISERSLKAEVTSVDELTVNVVVYGSLEDEQVSLSELLVDKSFAVECEAKENEPEYPYSALSYTSIPAKVGDKLNLFYVSADSPASIWCQLSDSENDLLALMDQLGAFYGNIGEQDWALEAPVVGAAVSAQFTEDDSWYRAEILETSPSITVRFIDYGNCEELPLSRVKRLKQEFALLPKQALSIALTGVSAKSLEEWSEEKTIAMEELCSEKCYVGEVHLITDAAMEASLRDQESQAMMLDVLCEAELIVKKSEVDALISDVPKSETTLEVEVPCNADVLASSEITVKYSSCHYEPEQDYVFYSLSIQSPRCIWLQDSRSEDELHEMQEKMQEFYSSPSASALEIAEVGTPCCALFEEHWYRAEVTSRNETEMVKVFFVDWGNSDTLPVTELKELLPEFMQLRRQAVCVSLSGVDTSEDWQQHHADKLKELCDTETLTASIVESCNGILTVKLFSGELTEKSVNELLKDFVGVIPEETDSSNEEGAVTVENQGQPLNETPALTETLVDERPSIETPPDEILASTTSDGIQYQKLTPTPSPGDSEEDVNDPQAVCQAIDRLLTEIETRTAEGDSIVTQEISDTELVSLEVEKLQAEADHSETICNEEVIGTTPPEEIEAASDEGPVESAVNTEQNGASCVPESESNIESNTEMDVNASDSGTEVSEPEAVAAERNETMGSVQEHTDEIICNDSLEFDTPLTKLQSAPESDSNTCSSSATPFLSPEVELADESPSDELSSYLTPPDEPPTETGKDEQAVLSSPEADRSDSGDVQTRYAYPEIKLGDIHKVKISYILSPSNFFCQLSRTAIEVCHLMETIQTTFIEHTEDTLTIDTPSIGIPCCAQSPEDDKWYRAIISSLGNENYVNVTLVDIGKTLSLPVGRLKAISDELVTSLPRQAVHCSLVDLEPADVEWSADAVTKMNEVCAGKELEGIFRSRHQKVYEIYLRDPENNASDFVNKLLVDLKLAKVTGRDCDTEEAADSNGNGVLDQASVPEEFGDEQISANISGNETNQSESKVKTTESVKEILDNMLESIIDQAVQNKTHLTIEKVDVVGEINKSDDVTCVKIQDESELTKEMSAKMLDDTLVTSEICSLETETTSQDNVVTTVDDKSTDSVPQHGLNIDVSVTKEEGFHKIETALQEGPIQAGDGFEVKVPNQESRDDEQLLTGSSIGNYQSEYSSTDATESVKEFLDSILQEVIEASTNNIFDEENKSEEDESTLTKKTCDKIPDGTLATIEGEPNKMETRKCVKEILGSILERATDQAVKSETDLAMEDVDVLDEKNKSEGVTGTEIQDGSGLIEGTSDETQENTLVTREVCNSKTGYISQVKVVATNDSESTDFLGESGLKQDVSLEGKFSETTGVVNECNTEVESELRNVTKNGECCVVEGDISNEVSNDDSEQKYFDIYTEVDCVKIDSARINKTDEESDNRTLTGVHDEDQHCFVEEQSDKVVHVVETGSERNNDKAYTVPADTLKSDDGECGEDGQEVKTNVTIHCDWHGEALKSSSVAQENASAVNVEVVGPQTAPNEICPEIGLDFSTQGEDASVDASGEEITAFVEDEMESNEGSSRAENGEVEETQVSLKMMDSTSNIGSIRDIRDVAEQEKMKEHVAASLFDEGIQSSDKENEGKTQEDDINKVNGIDETKSGCIVECDKEDEDLHGVRGKSENVQGCETDTMKQSIISCSDVASDSDVENVLVDKSRLEMNCSNISAEKAILHDLVSDVALREEPLSGNDEDFDID